MGFDVTHLHALCMLYYTNHVNLWVSIQKFSREITLTSRISVRSHLFFFELLETRFCLIWVVTLIFFKDIWKFAQQFIQILSVFHAESPNVRLKIAIFSTFTLYLNFKLNVWAKRQTVYPLGHTYLKGHTYYFEGA